MPCRATELDLDGPVGDFIHGFHQAQQRYRRLLTDLHPGLYDHAKEKGRRNPVGFLTYNVYADKERRLLDAMVAAVDAGAGRVVSWEHDGFTAEGEFEAVLAAALSAAPSLRLPATSPAEGDPHAGAQALLPQRGLDGRGREGAESQSA